MAVVLGAAMIERGIMHIKCFTQTQFVIIFRCLIKNLFISLNMRLLSIFIVFLVLCSCNTDKKSKEVIEKKRS